MIRVDTLSARVLLGTTFVDTGTCAGSPDRRLCNSQGPKNGSAATPPTPGGGRRQAFASRLVLHHGCAVQGHLLVGIVTEL